MTDTKMNQMFPNKKILFPVVMFVASLFLFTGCNTTKNTVRLYTCSGETYTTYSKTGYKKSKHRIKFLQRHNKVQKTRR
jgi:uncharacterized protein YgiB involved in biofilm formation